MCGIVGYVDRRGRPDQALGGVLIRMMRVLGPREPDSSGVAVLRSGDGTDMGRELEPGVWKVRLHPVEPASTLEPLDKLGQIHWSFPEGQTRLIAFRPRANVRPDALERALDTKRGGRELLSVGASLDLVKWFGRSHALDSTYGVSAWQGEVGVGQVRLAGETPADLAHAQPVWIHGMLDYAVVHVGQITNGSYLRRLFRQRGVALRSDGDAELIGVYLRDRMDRGKTLKEALQESIHDLDGMFAFLVAYPGGLGVACDKMGHQSLWLGQGHGFLAVASDEFALRQALPAEVPSRELPPGSALCLGQPLSKP